MFHTHHSLSFLDSACSRSCFVSIRIEVSMSNKYTLSGYVPLPSNSLTQNRMYNQQPHVIFISHFLFRLITHFDTPMSYLIIKILKLCKKVCAYASGNSVGVVSRGDRAPKLRLLFHRVRMWAELETIFHSFLTACRAALFK